MGQALDGRPTSLMFEPKSLAETLVGNAGWLGLAEFGIGKEMATAVLAASGVSDAIKHIAEHNARLVLGINPLVDWKPGSALASVAERCADQTKLFTQLVPDGALGRLGALGIQPPLDFKVGLLSDYADSFGLVRTSSLSQVIRSSETFQRDIGKWQTPQLKSFREVVDSTSLLAGRAHELAECLAPVISRSDLKLTQPSAASFRALEAYTRGLHTSPTLSEVAVVGWGARTASGLLSGAVVAAPVRLDSPADMALDDLLGDDSYQGDGLLFESLLLILDGVDPQAREHLLGAFEALGSRHGAAQKAALMLVESIDWLLRTVAPEAEVMQWAEGQTARRRNRFVHVATGGVERSTLTGRVGFVVRNGDAPLRKLAETQAELVSEVLPQLRRIAEGQKHGGAVNGNTGLVRSMAVTLVGLLGIMFCQP